MRLRNIPGPFFKASELVPTAKLTIGFEVAPSSAELAAFSLKHGLTVVKDMPRARMVVFSASSVDLAAAKVDELRGTTGLRHVAQDGAPAVTAK